MSDLAVGGALIHSVCFRNKRWAPWGAACTSSERYERRSDEYAKCSTAQILPSSNSWNNVKDKRYQIPTAASAVIR